MLEELKQRGRKYGTKRSLIGIIVFLFIAALCYSNVARFGVIPATWPWFLPGVGLLIIIAVARNWLKVSGGSITKGIEKFCQKTPNPEATMARLEQTWRDGLDLIDGRIDSEYIIFADKLASAVLPLENAVWAYKNTVSRNGVKHLFSLIIYYKDGKLEPSLVFNYAGPVDKALGYILERCPHIAVGYDKETEKLRKDRNIAGFQEYALAQRAKA
jgi:hypothetical protein